MALVGSVCIDRYEAHLVVLDANGKQQPHPHTERPAAGARYAARSLPGVMPQGYVNRGEASDACQNAGKRLCSLTEWYAACAGQKRQTFPYGPVERDGLCNVRRPHLLGKLFGSDPRRWSYDDHFNSPRLNREPGFLALTGAHPECVTPTGVYDLVGNLHEWVSDRVDWELPKKIQLLGSLVAKIDDNFGKGIFMGGFYSTHEEHGPGCRFVTIGHGARYHDYSTGFRCCVDATAPTTPKPAPAPR